MSEGIGGFDFSELGAVAKRQDQGVAVHIKHPSRGPLYYQNGDGQMPVTFTVVGTYSETYRRNERERMDLITSGKRSTANMFDTTEQLSSAVIAWDGVFNAGVPVPLTREAVSKVLTSEPWIAEQLLSPTREHERFFSENSAS